MALKVTKIKDNTRRETMVSPDGHRCQVFVSPRHNGGRSIDYYRKRGFKTLAEVEQEKRFAALEAENAALKGGKAAKAEKGQGGGKAAKAEKGQGGGKAATEKQGEAKS